MNQKSPSPGASKDPYRFYNRIYRVLRALLCPPARALTRFEGEPVPEIQGPILILCNHNTDIDFLLLGSVFPRVMDFVVTDSIARMGPFLSFLPRLMHPILHEKGSVGVATVRRIVGRLKEGRCVCLFPEGNRSFDGLTCPIPEATGALARLGGATLVLYRLQGGYLTSPRWGKGFRRGRMKGEVTGIYSLKELKEMSQGDLQRTIEQALYTDAYEEQRLSPTPFSSRHGAEYLESLLFSCPSCQAIGTLSSHKDRLRCSCGYEAIYTPYGTLKEASGSEKTLTEALKEEKERLSLLLAASSKEPLWSDQVTLSQIDANHQVLWKKEATLQAFGNGLRLDGTFLPSEQVTSISVVQRNRMSLHLRAQAETYELCGPPTFNALKYQLWERALGDQATLSFKETKEIED